MSQHTEATSHKTRQVMNALHYQFCVSKCTCAMWMVWSVAEICVSGWWDGWCRWGGREGNGWNGWGLDDDEGHKKWQRQEREKNSHLYVWHVFWATTCLWPSWYQAHPPSQPASQPVSISDPSSMSLVSMVLSICEEWHCSAQLLVWDSLNDCDEGTIVSVIVIVFFIGFVLCPTRPPVVWCGRRVNGSGGGGVVLYEAFL